MYKLNHGSNRKKVYFVLFAIVALAVLYISFAEDEYGETPTLHPHVSHYKTIAQVHKDISAPDGEKNIYENFVLGSKKKTKIIKLLPDPEEPVILKQDLAANNGVFSDILEENVDSSKEIAPLVQSNSTNNKKSDSIWDNLEEEVTDLATDAVQGRKSLNVTTIVNKKQLPNLFNNRTSNELFYLQLAHSRSRQELLTLWNKIKSNNKKALASYNHKIIKQKREKIVFYELLVGPFNQFKQAKHMCSHIKLEKHKCLVVKK